MSAQGFRLVLRKQGAAEDQDPTVSIQLYENGSLVRELVTDQAITSLTGETIDVSWSASELVDASGADAELRLVATRPVTIVPGGNERQAPVEVSQAVNYTVSGADALALIDDDPDDAIGDWLEASGGDLDTHLRAHYDFPAAPLKEGADLQEYRIRVRDSGSRGVTMTVRLYYITSSGSAVLIEEFVTEQSVTSTSGEIFSYTFDAADIAGTAEQIAISILGYGPEGGPANQRGSLEVDAVEWNAETDELTAYESGVDLDAARWDVAIADVGISGTASATLGALTAAATATATAPPIEAVATAILGALSTSADATAVAPTFDATAQATLGPLALAATGEQTAATWHASANLQLGALTSSAGATAEVPSYEATATLSLGSLQVTADATAGVREFEATASATLGALTLVATADVGEVQRGRPTRTTANKAWTNELGETEDLHLSVDEEEPDYADYAQSAAPPGDNKFGTGFTMPAPVSDAMHAIAVEAARHTGDRQIDLHVTVLEGGVERASFVQEALSDTPTRYVFELTEAEAAAINNYSNLEVTFQAFESGGGSSAGGRVHWVAFETAPAQADSGAAYIALGQLEVGSAATVEAPAYEGSGTATLGPVAVSAEGTQATVNEGVATVTLGALTADAAATAEAPSYEASATLALGALTATAGATVEAPAFEASATIDLGPLAAAGTATLAAATFEGTATAALAPLATVATATAEAPGTTATAGVALPSLTAAAAATTEVPAYEATAMAELGALATSAQATHVAAGISGSASIELSPLQAEADATTEVPSYEASAGMALAPLSAESTATSEAPTFDATSTVALGALTASATAEQGIPDVDATVDLALPSLEAASEAAQVRPGYSATASLMLGPLVATASAQGEYDPRDYYPRNPGAAHYNPHSATERHQNVSSVTAGHRKRGETT